LIFHVWVVYSGDKINSLDEKISVIPVKVVSGRWNYTLDR